MFWHFRDMAKILVTGIAKMSCSEAEKDSH
jgi:hypothetical protein